MRIKRVNTIEIQLAINKRHKKSVLIQNAFLVGLPGFEPRQTEPKTVVLPLHNNPILYLRVAKIMVQVIPTK